MALGSGWVDGAWVDAGWATNAWYQTANATSITIRVTGGENLTSLSYCVFDGPDVGIASLIKQGNDESTDSNGDLVIDITGLGVMEDDILTVVINNYTALPTTSNRVAGCFGTAVA